MKGADAIAGIEAKYWYILQSCADVLALQSRLLNRYARGTITHPWRSFADIHRLFSRGTEARQADSQAFLLGHSTDEQRRQLKAAAKETDRAEPLFEIATSAVVPEQLAGRAIDTLALASRDIEALTKIHEHKRVAPSRFSLKTIFGFAIGAGGLVATSVPKELFTRNRWDYGAFRVWVFWILVGTLTYLAVIVLPIWREYRRTQRAYELCGAVLAYAAAVTPP
jgi:hypothetical protein